jgi:hypothetical protein
VIKQQQHHRYLLQFGPLVDIATLQYLQSPQPSQEILFLHIDLKLTHLPFTFSNLQNSTLTLLAPWGFAGVPGHLRGIWLHTP